MSRLDISSFFNHSNTSGLGSLNFSDYALIKSGSYGKLMKAYYADDKGSTAGKADKSDKTDKKKVQEKIDSTGAAKMKSEADGLKKAAESLQKDELWKETNGKYDTSKVVSAVKKFADEYNDVIAQSSKVTSSDILRQTNYMTSMTKTMSKALDKVGVKVDSDGKLSVDEDKLKKASAKDVKALFSGSYSYISQIADKAGAISSAATKDSGLYASNGALSDTVSSMFSKLV